MDFVWEELLSDDSDRLQDDSTKYHGEGYSLSSSSSKCDKSLEVTQVLQFSTVDERATPERQETESFDSEDDDDTFVKFLKEEARIRLKLTNDSSSSYDEPEPQPPLPRAAKSRVCITKKNVLYREEEHSSTAAILQHGISESTVISHGDILFFVAPAANNGTLITTLVKPPYGRIKTFGSEIAVTVNGASPSDLRRIGLQLKQINSGTFCSVFRALYHGIEVAVKCPDETLLRTDSEMMKFRSLQEWKILSRCKSPRILKFYGGVVLRDQFWLVTEYVKRGDLYALLYHQDPRYLRPRNRFELIEQLCEAVVYMHHALKPKVIHKDLKCNNILVTERMELKVCDFGDAEEMVSTFLQCCTAATWQYTPPELIATENPARPKGATEKVDIWAMGCIFLEILNSSTPFIHILDRVPENKQRDVLRSLYLEGRLQSECHIPDHIPFSIKSIIRDCLNFDAEARPTAVRILQVLRRGKDSMVADLLVWQAQWESMRNSKTEWNDLYRAISEHPINKRQQQSYIKQYASFVNDIRPLSKYASIYPC